MTWTKLDDSFWSNPKVTAVGNEAAGAYARMLSYCGDHLTDGRVPPEMAKFIARPAILRKLEEFSFIVANGTGYLIPDFLEFNPSAALVTQRRSLDARRAALHRDKTLINAVRARDGSDCRYCGQEVDFTDRRSEAGGTYDHVDPYGENVVENLVVACRGCNSSKGARTPGQAGMVLRGI